MGDTAPRDVFVRRLRELIADGKVGYVADAAGVSREMFSRWRTGSVNVNPKLDSIERIAAALDVPVAYLISDGAEDEILAAQEKELQRLRLHIDRLGRLFSMMETLLADFIALDKAKEEKGTDGE